MAQSKIKYFLQMWWLDMKFFPGKFKSRVWNGGFLLWWYRLWIRKDEFHKSLDMDGSTAAEMSKKKRSKYLIDLLQRRKVAYQKNIDQRDQRNKD